MPNDAARLALRDFGPDNSRIMEGQRRCEKHSMRLMRRDRSQLVHFCTCALAPQCSPFLAPGGRYSPTSTRSTSWPYLSCAFSPTHDRHEGEGMHEAKAR